MKETGADNASKSNRIQYRSAYSWLISLLINAVILLYVFFRTDLIYETNDDYTISLILRNGYDNLLLINRYLCSLLLPFYTWFPGKNIFVYFQLIISFIAFTVILRLLLDSKAGIAVKILSAALILYYSFDHYCIIQYTKTAALVITAGTLLLADTMLRKRSCLDLIPGVVLVYIGACMRFNTFYVACAFAGLYVLLWLITDRGDIDFAEFFTTKRLTAFAVALVMLFAVFAVRSMARSGPDIKDYAEYNLARSKVIDYHVYWDYDSLKDELKEAGISKNDLSLINSWYLDSEGAASLDKLNRINSIYSDAGIQRRTISEAAIWFCSETFKDMRHLNKNGVHAAIFIMLVIGELLCFRPKYWPTVLAVSALTFALYIYLFYNGRIVYRGTYILFLSGTLWLLYYADSKRLHLPAWVMNAGCLLMILLLVFSQQLVIHRLPELFEGREKAIYSMDMQNYMAEHADKLFVFSTKESKEMKSYMFPLLIRDDDVQPNCTTFGGWSTMSQYRSDLYAKYGLDNVFGDIIDNDDVYIVETKRPDDLEKYFNKWYGDKHGKMHLRHIDDVSGCSIWQMRTQ